PSSTPELPDRYDPAATAADLYAAWQAAGLFTANAARSARTGGERDPFTIVIPPPNVTAVLHMGHGLDNTLQDVLIRWRRMAGDEALWVPGTDHAGIATQNVIEKQLAAEGLTRFDVGREAFVARTTSFVEETGGVILQQLRAIGASCDWTRTGYTLSPQLSRAVREAFVRLYEAGLVYRGHRVIHWCPRCLTSLSDEEAEFHDSAGRLYHVAYPLADDPSRTVVVATTRPETMLGDVAVAVHPDDERYHDIIGRMVRLPITGIEIPVVADSYADPEFGTGVVKITPAHDANDFEVGRRHSLRMPVVIDETGTVRAVSDADGRVPESLSGLDRVDARRRVVELLEAEGRLVKVEPHAHAVRHCYRCDTVVEPRLSDQWFVKMEPLARPALAAMREGSLRILPERHEATYFHWLENIRDWNISRQLWWGHRIPVWYCESCSDPIVSRDDVTACPRCGGGVRQDEDVLDTWFSSWLWPLSTLGWPDEDAADLRAFYPTDVLVSGPDILFFWIARMVMAGYFFVGQSPFHTIFLHGIARDTEGRKMSKSLGNGIDPLDVVERFGADALRYTVVAGMGLGVDIVLDPADMEKSFATGRNFVTKLWNIGRFLLTNVGQDPVRTLDELQPAALTRADHWILARLDAAVADCDAALGPARPIASIWAEADRTSGLRLNEYADAARHFVWNELADWYLESVKGRLAEPGADREVARAVLAHAFDRALRLLHPIIPFVTESLWQRLPGRLPGEHLPVAAWPGRDGTADTAQAIAFDHVRDAVTALRQIRSDYNLPPSRIVDAVIVADGADGSTYDGERALVGRLARARVSLAAAAPAGAAAHALLTGGASVVVPLAGLVDLDRECAKLRTELAQLEKQLGALESRLANEGFLARAPQDIVAAERQKALDWTARRDQLREKVRALCGD
ncbi:MAG: valine--tRNA ligase, partial [Gemmatimonadaceae bacterium]